MIGLLGAYETLNFRSTSLDGRVRGDGWSVGVYTGGKISRGLLLEGAVANTSVKYDGQSGTAVGSTTGSRWLFHGALTGRWEMDRLEVEPSLRTFAQTETDKAYTDSLGTPQPGRKFTAGRTSAGVKFSYRIGSLGEAIVTPYVGIYEDYYFTSDSNAASLLLPEFYQGLSTRLTAGIGLSMPSGIKGSFGGEVGGIGSNTFNVWSVRGRLSFPF